MFFVVNDKKVPLDSLLNKLKNDRKSLDAYISVLEKLPDVLPQLVASSEQATERTPPPRKRTAGLGGPFVGMSAPAAAQECLRRAGKPLHIRELIAAMLAGGFTTEARNFEPNLYTVLAKRPGMFARAGRGIWALV